MILSKSTYAPTFGPSNNIYRNLSCSYTSNNTKVHDIRLFTVSLFVQLTLDQHEGQGTHSLCSQKFTYNFTVSLLYPQFASTDSTNLNLTVLQCRRPQLNSWVGKSPRRRYILPTPVFLNFLVARMVKESACNVGDLGSIPGLGRSPGEGHGNPVQYSCLDNSMDRGAWQVTVHGVSESQAQLND